MDASTITAQASTGLPPKAAGGDDAPSKMISSDFETFLRMLATQLKNQDPMNPIESADYAVQLATFSSVEQQVRTNELLEGLVARQGMGEIAGYAGWIGLEGRSPGPARFDGAQPVELAPNPLSSADRARLIVRDMAGEEVARLDIPVSADPYFWDGRTAGGKLLPAGLYAFELENIADGEVVVTDQLETYGRITEARTENGQVLLVRDGGVTVVPEAVTGLRDPTG